MPRATVASRAGADRRPDIVRPVARDVDRQAGIRRNRWRRKAGRCKSSAAPIEVPRIDGLRRRGQLAGDGVGRRRAIDQAPGNDHRLGRRPGPFDEGEGDSAIAPARIASDHVGMAQRRDIAAALELPLVSIHRARDVDGQHQLEIDRQVLGDRRPCRSRARGGNHRDEHAREEAHGLVSRSRLPGASCAIACQPCRIAVFCGSPGAGGGRCTRDRASFETAASRPPQDEGCSSWPQQTPSC